MVKFFKAVWKSIVYEFQWSVMRLRDWWHEMTVVNSIRKDLGMKKKRWWE